MYDYRAPCGPPHPMVIRPLEQLKSRIEIALPTACPQLTLRGLTTFRALRLRRIRLRVWLRPREPGMRHERSLR